MSMIKFEAKVVKIGSWTLIRLPKSVSEKLPSRGMVMVEGTISGYNFQMPLEPDGKGSHWFKVDETLHKAVKVDVGETIELEIEPIKDWPEPEVSEDLEKALKTNPAAYVTWRDITPIARWDWVRWIGSTKNLETRKIRIEKTFGKFKSGIRRPCCFNRTECSVPDVSHKGVLLESTQTV